MEVVGDSRKKIYNKFSKYYDAIYANKPYKEEAGYIDSLVKQYLNVMPDECNVLDIGCGTGKHAISLARMGYNRINCVDISSEMIDIAKSNVHNELESPLAERINLYNMNIVDFNLEEKHQFAYSMFSVMSYIVDTEEFVRAIKAIRNSVGAGGILVFDVWYGPNVLRTKPEVRVKKIIGKDFYVYRIATPNMLIEKNIVQLDYELVIYDSSNKEVYEVAESHKLRYWFLPEIEYILKNCGFEIMRVEKCVTGEPLENDIRDYYACFVVRKKG